MMTPPDDARPDAPPDTAPNAADIAPLPPEPTPELLPDDEAEAADEALRPAGARSEAPAPTLLPRCGDHVGPWLLEELLGHGAQAVVFRASDGRGALAALKIGLRADPLLMARFQRETRLSASLRHPGLVPVIDQGLHQGLPWLALELVVGASLAAVLERGGGPDDGGPDDEGLPTRLRRCLADGGGGATVLDADTVIALGLTLCGILAHLHDHGVVHRDLKPANILIGRDGRILVADLGTALDDGPRITLGGAPGTPGFMAPEQQRGSPVDRRADIFALGRVLLACLLGLDPPTQGGRRQAAPLRRVLERACHEDPDERHPTMQAFGADLERIAAGEEPAPAPRYGLRRIRRRLRSHPYALALAAGLVVAGLAVVVDRHRHAQRVHGAWVAGDTLDAATLAQRQDREAWRLHDGALVPGAWPAVLSSGGDLALGGGLAIDADLPRRRPWRLSLAAPGGLLLEAPGDGTWRLGWAGLERWIGPAHYGRHRVELRLHHGLAQVRIDGALLVELPTGMLLPAGLAALAVAPGDEAAPAIHAWRLDHWRTPGEIPATDAEGLLGAFATGLRDADRRVLEDGLLRGLDPVTSSSSWSGRERLAAELLLARPQPELQPQLLALAARAAEPAAAALRLRLYAQGGAEPAVIAQAAARLIERYAQEPRLRPRLRADLLAARSAVLPDAVRQAAAACAMADGWPARPDPAWQTLLSP